MCDLPSQAGPGWAAGVLPVGSLVGDCLRGCPRIAASSLVPSWLNKQAASSVYQADRAQGVLQTLVDPGRNCIDEESSKRGDKRSKRSWEFISSIYWRLSSISCCFSHQRVEQQFPTLPTPLLAASFR